MKPWSRAHKCLIVQEGGQFRLTCLCDRGLSRKCNRLRDAERYFDEHLVAAKRVMHKAKS